MARLGSQAKAGYYPTPESVCKILKSKISYEDGARLLDPCCGKGVTLSKLMEDAPNRHTLSAYGIELEHERANEARSRLKKVLWGDALTETYITPGTFGLVYLNPPYDFDFDSNSDADKKKARLELLFLRRFLEVVQYGGWLVFLVPYYILRYCSKLLSRHFDNIQVYSIPNEDFEVFKQCILIGQKRPIAKDQAMRTQVGLDELSGYEPDEFLANVLDLEMAGTLVVPEAKKPLNIFKARNIDPLEAIPQVKKAGILESSLLELTPKPRTEIRPLTPLENGHIALMLAGGFMNGAVQKDGTELVIKGMVRKEELVVDERNQGEQIVTRDKYVPMVKVIDLTNKEIFIVE